MLKLKFDSNELYERLSDNDTLILNETLEERRLFGETGISYSVILI